MRLIVNECSNKTKILCQNSIAVDSDEAAYRFSTLFPTQNILAGSMDCLTARSAAVAVPGASPGNQVNRHPERNRSALGRVCTVINVVAERLAQLADAVVVRDCNHSVSAHGLGTRARHTLAAPGDRRATHLRRPPPPPSSSGRGRSPRRSPVVRRGGVGNASLLPWGVGARHPRQIVRRATLRARRTAASGAPPW